ncbi:MAG: hypothetical protein PVH07_10775 [Chloroflexota bacterium]
MPVDGGNDMKKRLMVGLVAAGLLLTVAPAAGAQDYSGSIKGSLTLLGNIDPFNNLTVSINASGDPTGARGTYHEKVTYRNDAGAIVTVIQVGRVTCFARIGNRAYVEHQVTKVIGGSAGGAQVGDYFVEAWEDNRATGEPDRHSDLALGFPGAGHCDDPVVIALLDDDLDLVLPGSVIKGNVTIR